MAMSLPHFAMLRVILLIGVFTLLLTSPTSTSPLLVEGSFLLDARSIWGITLPSNPYAGYELRWDGAAELIR